MIGHISKFAHGGRLAPSQSALVCLVCCRIVQFVKSFGFLAHLNFRIDELNLLLAQAYAYMHTLA